jgi:glycine betaine catabolism A
MSVVRQLRAEEPAIDLGKMIKNYRRNGPLESEFYASEQVFAADMQRIWGRWWLFAGHGCTIPRPGDYFTYQVGRDPILVVRGEDGQVRAFFNTCRHRGARVCTAEAGSAKRLVCPYHNWTYDLGGRLLMDSKEDYGVDRSELSLHPVHVRDAAGLIFISLARNPPSFDEAFATISRKLKPHGMARAKIAHTADYVVKANWKIIFENNRECMHCPPNHKEYNLSTYDVMRDQARSDPARAKQMDAIIAESNARFRALGLDEGDASSSMTGTFFRCHRTPLRKGFVSQTLDGKPACRLPMGDFKEHDVGTLRITIFPNFWQHSNSDYAAAARLTPLAPGLTAVRGYWLVHEDAVEGKDYTLDKLLPAWGKTNEQDWEICENQQIGVSSSRYQPGYYSLSKEGNVAHFDEWYLGEMSRAT